MSFFFFLFLLPEVWLRKGRCSRGLPRGRRVGKEPRVNFCQSDCAIALGEVGTIRCGDPDDMIRRVPSDGLRIISPDAALFFAPPPSPPPGSAATTCAPKAYSNSTI